MQLTVTNANGETVSRDAAVIANWLLTFPVGLHPN
jgi:hypothetical protein